LGQAEEKRAGEYRSISRKWEPIHRPRGVEGEGSELQTIPNEEKKGMPSGTEEEKSKKTS